MKRRIVIGLWLLVAVPIVSPCSSAMAQPAALAPSACASNEEKHAECSKQPGEGEQDVKSRCHRQAELQAKLAELEQLQRQIDELRAALGTPDQIHVKVQMLEVSLTKLRRLGMDFGALLNAGRDAQLGNQSNITVPAERGAWTYATIPQPVARQLFERLRENNVARALAEPSIVALSGRPASFRSGGEVPLPAKLTEQRPEFLYFGTEVDVVPTALGEGRVRLDLRASVSTLDDTHSITHQGARVPGLKRRSCATTCELSFGESAVLGGLVEQRTEEHLRENGSRATVMSEVALFVVVTPEVVSPLRAAAAPAEANDSK